MVDFTKVPFSASTDYKPIKVVATATAGTLIHTAQAGTGGFDEIWLWACNTNTADVIITVEWGDATAPDSNIVKTIAFKTGEVSVIPGIPLRNGLTVKVFASVANVVTISGFVNRAS